MNADPPPAAAMFAPGSRIGKYLLDEQIGHGGMAAVFKARDEMLGRVDARDVTGATPAEQQAALLRVIEPIATGVKIDHWAPEQDIHGNLVGYHVWVQR